MKRNYMVIEVTENGSLFFTEGKGIDAPEELNPDDYWHDPEFMQNREELIKRIRKQLNKKGD